MKDSKTYITQYVALIAALQVFVVTYVSLPQLETARTFTEESLFLPAGTIWIPLVIALVLGNAIVVVQLRRRVTGPLNRLAQQTKMGISAVAYKTKSACFEEDVLKHFIEGQVFKLAEMDQEIQRLQAEVEDIENLSKISPDEYHNLQKELAAAKQLAEERLTQIEEKEKEKAKIRSSLEFTEKALAKTSRELDAVQNEVQNSEPAPVENAPNDAQPAPSGSDTESLTNALSLINNLAWRLAKSWAESTPATMRDGFEEITKHSQKQLDALRGKRAD